MWSDRAWMRGSTRTVTSTALTTPTRRSRVRRARASTGWCVSAPISRRRSRRSTSRTGTPTCTRTVGLHPHDASKLGGRVGRCSKRSPATEECVGDRRGRASTSTTSTRRATSRRWRSGSRSGSRTRLGKPLVIHSRDAWDDTFRVLDDEGVPERTIFHCFTGGPDEARARARPRLLPVVQRHRVVQERRRPARRRRASRPPTGCSSRPTAVPRAGAVPRQAERARVRGRGRRRARRGARRGRRRRSPTVTRANAARSSASSGDADARSARCSTSTDVRPSKALGQHFLADPNTAARIVRLAGVEPRRPRRRGRPGRRVAHARAARTRARACSRSSSTGISLPVLERRRRARDVERRARRRADRRLAASCSPAVTAGRWCRTFRTTSRRRSSCARSKTRR